MKSSGKRYFWDSLYIPGLLLVIAGIFFLPSGSAYASTNIQSAESLSESMETVGTRTNKVQLQFTPSSSSNWLIIFSCEVNSTGADAANIAVFNVVNGTDKTSVVESCGDTAIDYRSVISFYYVTGQTAQQTYKIDFNRVGGSIAKIRNARIVAIRTDVSGNDVRYNESLAEATDIGNTYTSRASVTFTPAAGDYLVLGFCEGSSDSTTYSWLARLNVDSASYIPIDSTGYYTQEDVVTTVWQPFFAAKVVSLTNASHTISLETASETGITSADTRAHRVIAVRLTAVWTFQQSQTDAVTTNTATSPQVRDTLNTNAPAQGKECLVLMAQHNKNTSANNSCYGEYEVADVIKGYNRHEPKDTSDWWSGGVALHLSEVSTSKKLETTWYGDTGTATHSIKNSMIVYIEIENSPVTLSISVSPLTWGIGTVDAGTVQVSTSGNKIGITNDGNVSETFTLQIYDEDDRDEWTHSSLETGAGNNIYVISGIFCATGDSPVSGSFNEGDSEDVITTSQQTATSSKFAYAGGSSNGTSVSVSGQRSLWLRLDMPTAVSGTYSYEQHTITVRISCQQS